MTSRLPHFNSVVLDVDSTLCAMEGVDWLAARRGAAVAEAVAALTGRAMDGELPLDAVYGERLRLITPTRADIAALADEYQRRLLPGARSAVARLRAAGIRVVLVSGGLRPALLPLAEMLGVPASDVHAVDVRFDDEGCFRGFDDASPLATQSGKGVVVRTLALPHPILAVGDGATDLAMAPDVDLFAAFTGVVRRDAVSHAAEHEVSTYEQILELALP
ncbi:MAG TPA: HAD-IB family phosphatase [Gemmatimonadaceae bacterium]|nr:HAD-IB family phosphatase [Gemmatimonadaceae bacterium]